MEEARAFKLYLDRKGPEALPDLAERVGINPCYIRRRTAVLGLPEEILQEWEKGNLAYGHLEQFIRIEGDELKEVYGYVAHGEWTVKNLKRHIEDRTPKLSTALFHPKKNDCATCQRNTDVQRSLFGEEIGTKALCFGPDCFKQKQGSWIQENWEKFRSSRNVETNGFRFQDDVSWDKFEHIWQETVKDKCKTCENLTSLIELSGSVSHKTVCIGEKSCYRALYQPSSKEAKKDADPNAPRVSWHGEFFREEFYKARIPDLVTALPPADEKILRITLLTIIEMHHNAFERFDEKYNSNRCKGYYAGNHAKAWPLIQKLEIGELRSILQELSLLILMDKETTPDTRRAVASHLGSDLSAEWRLTKEYLDKKTTKEIHALAEKFGFWKEDKAKAYIYETLGKKLDRFDTCKKGELVKVILESGIDLAGKVPDEILKEEKRIDIEAPESQQNLTTSIPEL